jgi:hypothetical protein
LPIPVDRGETRWLIRLENDWNITSAAELKCLLLEGLEAAKAIEVDLERAQEIDVTLLQLLWAAGRQGGRIVSHVPEAAAKAARDAGFAQFPGAGSRD